MGEDFEKDLVFISQDGKPDWQNNVNKKPFQPRFELIDEYRRSSKGKSFHITTLSTLLEHFEIAASTLHEIERIEFSHNRGRLSRTPVFEGSSIDETIDEMQKWFLANYEPPENNLPYESAEGGFIYIWGGPYDLEEELYDQFGDVVSENIIKVCVETIEKKYGYNEWSKIPSDGNNLWVDINPDWETGERAGAGGTFQVISITDENGRDLTKLINQGYHYHAVEDVLKDLSEKLGLDVDGELS